jgi:two-component system sensor histidine kinase VicK
MDALELQLVSALQRYSTLQRRAAGETVDQPKLFGRALKELEAALEDLKVAQEQLIENRHRMEHLQAELTQQYDKYWQLFDQMSDAYVVSKPDSTILEANKAAADFFNVSQRFLIGKTVSVFVCEDRSRFLSDAARVAAEGATAELTFKLRPRERAPLDVIAKVSGDGGSLRWILRTTRQVASQG